MIGDVKPSTKYVVRGLFVLLFLGGVALLAEAVREPDPPAGLWVLGGFATLVGGGFVFEWIRFRIKYPTREAAEAAKQAFIAANRPQIERLERGRLVRRAVREKDAILRAGAETTAVITFLADVDTSELVYLELEITPRFGPSYTVKTGERIGPAAVGSVAPGRELVVRVDPQDRERVAVDWDASLRLRRAAPAEG